ncbi:MAG: EAL domain-containing protein [Sneathiella sp.]|nr:EAL domain-containing protein [Sneathiella sp.]
MLYHIVIIAAYTLTAVVVSRQVPSYFPELEPTTGYWLGGALFLTCALLHEFIMRRVERANLQKEIKLMRRDLADAEIGLERFENILGGLAGDGADMDSFATEMQMLRKLLNQLTNEVKKEKKTTQIPQGNPSEIESVKASRPPLIAEREDLPEEKGRSKDEILEMVREGLQENRVDLYLQPVVRLPQRRAVFYEAFSRIRGPQGEIITPGQYLAIAEEAGLIGTVDNLLLIRCVQLIRRIRKRKNEIGFFVNVSARTLRDSSFFHQFVEFLDRNSDLNKSLILEFSQEDIDAATEPVKEGLKMLADMGFAFSMDRVTRLDIDFQKLGQDNFRYLKVAASDLLPGGAGLPMNIHPNDLQEALARAEIELIASMVEDEDTVIGLLDVEIGYGQGYLFGVPKPPTTAK